jgi:hypothetical protein
LSVTGAAEPGATGAGALVVALVGAVFGAVSGAADGFSAGLPWQPDASASVTAVVTATQ